MRIIDIMNIYDRIVDTKIEAFLSSVPRYKLLVLSADSSMPMVDSIDFEKDLSEVIFGINRSNVSISSLLCRMQSIVLSARISVIMWNSGGILFRRRLEARRTGLRSATRIRILLQ